MLKSFTLLAFPTGIHTDQIQVPVVLSDRQHLRAGDLTGSPQTILGSDRKHSAGVNEDLKFLRGLRDDGSFVPYFEGDVEYSVQVESVDFVPYKLASDRGAPIGTALLTLKTAGVLASVAVPDVAPSQVPNVLTAAGDTIVDLTWDAPYDGGASITSYDVRWSDDGGSSWTTTTGVGGLNYQAGGLTNDTLYWFEVRANNNVGSGPWSVSVSATPFAVTSGSYGDGAYGVTPYGG